VPITRLSPAGTADVQWTRLAGPGEPGVRVEAELDGLAAPVAVIEGDGVDVFPVLPDVPQAVAVSNTRTAAHLMCTP
jgi:hypothetical protein